MKQIRLLVFFYVLCINCFHAQVGIGTTNPDASSVLDINSTDKGVLIPKVSLSDIANTMLDGVNPAAAGLLIYNTNAGTIGGSGVGFYYFNGTIWERLITSSTVTDDYDWYEEGTTVAPDNISDDKFTLGNIAIGKNTADYPLDILSSTSSIGAQITLDGTDNSYKIGNHTIISNTGTGSHFGMDNFLIGSGSGERFGVRNRVTNSGNNTHYGVSNILSGSGNGLQFGTNNIINNTGNQMHYGSRNILTGTGIGRQYGTYNEIDNTGNANHFGTYSLLNGSGTGTHYGSYTRLEGNGSGNQISDYNYINNSGNAIHFGEYTYMEGSGSGTHNGSEVRLSGTGTGAQLGTINVIDNSGNGLHYGSYNVLRGAGTGTHYGNWTRLEGAGTGEQYANYANVINSGNGNHYVSYADLNSSGTGYHYGSHFRFFGDNSNLQVGYSLLMNNSANCEHYGLSFQLGGDGDGNKFAARHTVYNSGNGNHYGIYNWLTGTGTGNKFGSFNLIPNTAGGNHYGVYSNVLKLGSYAGYFLGNVSIGTTTGNNYVLPASRGTANQVMQTDGAGNVSWATLSTPTITATNGLNTSGSTVQLGGTLNQNTTITHNNYSLTHNLNSSGDFMIQEAGNTKFEVRDNGNIYFGGDTQWHDQSTSGTLLASLFDSGDDANFYLYSNGILQHYISTTTNTVFNDQGLATNFSIEGDTEPYLFHVRGGMDRIGIKTALPHHDLTIKQSNVTQASPGGLGLEHPSNTDDWKLYHSGAHLSFAENGVRRAYVEAGTGNYVITSDKRLKKNILPMTSVLDKLNTVNAFTYNYKDQQIGSSLSVGFIAQELIDIFPDAVKLNEEGFYGVNYDYFTVLAVKAIQEQQHEISELKTQNEALATKLKSLSEEIEAIKKLLTKSD